MELSTTTSTLNTFFVSKHEDLIRITINEEQTLDTFITLWDKRFDGALKSRIVSRVKNLKQGEESHHVRSKNFYSQKQTTFTYISTHFSSSRKRATTYSRITVFPYEFLRLLCGNIQVGFRRSYGSQLQNSRMFRSISVL